jgi:hypothetical protein
MGACAAGSADPHAEFGFSGALKICKQILNGVMERATSAAERSRFAALPLRYLEDVGMTASERVEALGYDELTIDGWGVVASHL